jgi:hypothetical protein
MDKENKQNFIHHNKHRAYYLKMDDNKHTHRTSKTYQHAFDNTVAHCGNKWIFTSDEHGY